MNIPEQLSADEASRLAVTAIAADLVDWARSVAVQGRVDLDDLIDVLDLLRTASVPERSASPRSSPSPPARTNHDKQSQMHQRPLGHTKISALGPGGKCRSRTRPKEARSVATIHAALDAGSTLIDSADAYHLGADEVLHNESLIARTLACYGADTSRGTGLDQVRRGTGLDQVRSPRPGDGRARDVGYAHRDVASFHQVLATPSADGVAVASTLADGSAR